MELHQHGGDIKREGFASVILALPSHFSFSLLRSIAPVIVSNTTLTTVFSIF